MIDATKTYEDGLKVSECVLLSASPETRCTRTEEGHTIHSNGVVAWPWSAVQHVLNGDPEVYLPTGNVERPSRPSPTPFERLTKEYEALNVFCNDRCNGLLEQLEEARKEIRLLRGGAQA